MEICGGGEGLAQGAANWMTALVSVMRQTHTNASPASLKATAVLLLNQAFNGRQRSLMSLLADLSVY